MVLWSLDCRPFGAMVLGSYGPGIVVLLVLWSLGPWIVVLLLLWSLGLCRPFGTPGRVIVVVLSVLVERRKEEGKEQKGERIASLYRKIGQCM